MSLTADQITEGAIYTVRLDRDSLSSKRFRDAVSTVKEEAGGKYDGATRTWTVKVGVSVTETLTCKAAWHDGSRASRAVDGDGECATCHGTGRKTNTEAPLALRHLRSLITAYGAAVERRTAETATAPRRAPSARGGEFAEYGDGFSPEEREAFGG